MDDYTHIGARLREARIKKGLTLDELQQVTKIQKRYLDAIEENRLDELPGDFFVKAFVRQYAEVVGISAEDLSEYETELKPHSEEESSHQEQLPTRSDLKRSTKSTKFQYAKPSQSSIPTFLMVLFFFLIIAIFWYFIIYDRDNNPSIQNDSPTESSVIVQQPASSEPGESEIESATKPTVTGGESVNGLVAYNVSNLSLPSVLILDVNETGSSWMQVVRDGTVVFEGTIEAGGSETIEIPASTKQVEVRNGYIPSTTLSFTGDVQLQNPANAETVQTQTYVITFEND